ncbi:MAG: hypothetical protein ACR2NV_12070 [Thermoleophilaceae bacterium]
MALIPAFCECGAVWATASFIAGDAAVVTMEGNRVGPCPECGGMSRVPDGVYSLVDDTLNVVTTAEGLGREGLQRLIEVLREARTPEEAAQRVSGEAPNLAPLVNLIVTRGSGQDWKQWAMLIATVLTVVLQYMQWQHPKSPSLPSAGTIAQEACERLKPRAGP